MFGTKKKLMAAVVMLVISAIMLTSASYAWFTISTNPEIKGIDTKVVVNEALEIALAKTTGNPDDWTTTSTTGKQYSWGNLLDLNDAELIHNDADDAKDGPYLKLNKTLRPSTLAATSTEVPDVIFKYPLYANGDGRISGLSPLFASKRLNGFGNLTDKVLTDEGHEGELDPTGKIYGYYIDFWVRSNVGGDLVLQTTAVNRSTGSGTLETVNAAEGSYFLADGETLADAALATGINIAFQNITDLTTIPVTGTPASKGDVTGNDYKKTFSSGVIVNDLAPNTPALVRMYVYLDGTAITNTSASTRLDSVTGKLNMQFKLVTDAGVDITLDSMNEQP